MTLCDAFILLLLLSFYIFFISFFFHTTAVGTLQLSGDLMSKDPQLEWVVLVDGRGALGAPCM